MLTEPKALTALSPLDGRYRSSVSEAADLFSEFALIKKRVEIEITYLLFLSDQHLIPAISAAQRTQLEAISSSFSVAQAEHVKEIEQQTKHDVKAVEYFLREEMTRLELPLSEFLHLALTSEDVNNLALSSLCLTAKNQVLVPQLKAVLQQLVTMASDSQAVVMIGRTHGQPAVPTTLGKEIMVLAYRLFQEVQELERLPIQGKLTGAVGTLSAHQIVFDQADWWKLSQEFVAGFGLQPQMYTTQILPAETYSNLFLGIVKINAILLDLSQDMWRYISDGYFSQTVSQGQVGSSTMPQKINPIDFENCEGNLGLANSLNLFFIQKLPVSRLQRDLSDSTVKRSFGTAIGYSLLAYKSLLRGLSKVEVNSQVIAAELDQHWEILAEPFQVLLRAAGDNEGYEKLKAFSQGKQITPEAIAAFVDSLSVADRVKQKMLALSPQTYVGIATEIVAHGATDINQYLQGES